MNDPRHFNREDSTQEQQYSFPYHHIPRLDEGRFSQHLYWTWGFRYIGGLELVLQLLEKEEFGSLLDVGCGDGRFLAEVGNRWNDKNLTGIDLDERAIMIAKALVPGPEFVCADITSELHSDDVFDVVTLVEVLEHISPTELPLFVKALARYHRKGGRLIITVPHINKQVISKHYQHFTGEMLATVVGDLYEVEEMIFFDKQSRFLGRVVSHLLVNRFFVLNSQPVLDFVYRIYKKFLFETGESVCGRICLVGRKR